MTLTGTITQAALATDFDKRRTDFNTSAQTAAKMWTVRVAKRDLASGDDVSTRCLDFTPEDDYELIALGIDTRGHASATIVCTATLEAIDGAEAALPEYMGHKTVSVSTTTSNGTLTQGRANYEPATGEKHFILKGITYRLRVSQDTASAADNVKAFALLASRRRRA